jgi:flagella basal body P-ring formation protein FlgA
MITLLCCSLIILCRLLWTLRRASIGSRVAVCAAVAGMAWFAAGGHAAEFRLRSQCIVDGSVVKLGDAAEVFSTDRKEAERLAAVELFPAPVAPQQRFLSVRELQDLLLLRGINLAEHTFSGASQITVQARGKVVAPPPRVETPQQPLSQETARKIAQRVCEAVAKYLKANAAANQPWKVEAELSDAEARLVSDASRTPIISGGESPWIGAQQFIVSVPTAKGPQQFRLDAQVTLPTTVVIATRSLARGAVIHATDVELGHAAAGVARDAPGEEGVGDFHDVAEVVGKETTRGIAAGKPLMQDSVRLQILVRRGEVVTVYAHASGIRIRTMARAKDDGGENELVAVESLTDRSTFFARVSGIREVEVYARSPRSEASQLGEPGEIVRR